jgi:hypothetical protein
MLPLSEKWRPVHIQDNDEYEHTLAEIPFKVNSSLQKSSV